LQTSYRDQAREEIKLWKILGTYQLPTVRGGIYDRNGKGLAYDNPKFFLQINYVLTRFLDDRFWNSKILSMIDEDTNREQASVEMHEKYDEDIEKILVTIEKCSEILDVDESSIKENIFKINEWIWRQRELLAWRRKFPESELLLNFKKVKRSVPYKRAMADFEYLLAESGDESPNETIAKLALEVDIREMHQHHPICEIETDQQLLDVQLAFVGLSGIEISPECERAYPYGSAACNIIGWVGSAQPEENKLFPDDIYSRYKAEEFSGKRGVEDICEVVLRGRRGEETYTKDDEILDRKETRFGKDVYLTIDIELQQRIESYLSDLNRYPDPNAEIGAVVLDVASCDILAMVSIPTFDLNKAGRNYNKLVAMGTNPLKDKTIYETFPPGSVIKPVILGMGLTLGKVTENTIISCPKRSAPKGWPNCIIYRKGWSSHDIKWAHEGGNTGRNAIKGSCNIYFSHLADSVPSVVLQQWLFKFGFGHKILPGPNYSSLLKELHRTEGAQGRLQESKGQISTDITIGKIENVLQLKPIKRYQKRLFGIGQGSMRVTVLQVANSMASIARGGFYKAPKLFIDETENTAEVDLGLSQKAVDVIRDGMSAVVNEEGGTARSAFKICQLDQRNIKIFGKTGSTEGSENAWFAGFAEDITGRAVAIAIVVKGGQSGATDAAPKGRDILGFCNEYGYIGVSEQRVSGK